MPISLFFVLSSRQKKDSCELPFVAASMIGRRKAAVSPGPEKRGLFTEMYAAHSSIAVA
jgi:hypothetical protein